MRVIHGGFGGLRWQAHSGHVAGSTTYLLPPCGPVPLADWLIGWLVLMTLHLVLGGSSPTRNSSSMVTTGVKAFSIWTNARVRNRKDTLPAASGQLGSGSIAFHDVVKRQWLVVAAAGLMRVCVMWGRRASASWGLLPHGFTTERCMGVGHGLWPLW